MASKAGRKFGKAAGMAGKQVMDKSKQRQTQTLKPIIPCGKAVAAPPLGPRLGQLGVAIGTFCRDFNEKTAHFKPGIPMRTKITVNPDRSYQLDLLTPPTSYFLKQAAGIEKAAMVGGGEVSGKLTLKHIYEIAKIKSEDPAFLGQSLQNICKGLIGTCRSCGIKVVPSLDVEEYTEFLEERRAFVKAEEERLEELKQAKMLRI
ncbi:39S ribosomal protein L11, mitochondrial isoform X2 [Octopus sinensis]|uniref:Large ribosomal subunit protein uL11m n=1 Tax=Octopus sinensis TaxID=2607531 RepID=A0A6P7SC73_9MOLL|nr:39S ribosomal protein L11, mitochondrial isoform X2 [Octopus sinensis]